MRRDIDDISVELMCAKYVKEGLRRFYMFLETALQWRESRIDSSQVRRDMPSSRCHCLSGYNGTYVIMMLKVGFLGPRRLPWLYGGGGSGDVGTCLEIIDFGGIEFSSYLASEVTCVKKAKEENRVIDQRVEIMVGWTPPRMGWMKLNTDGASYGNPGLASAGGGCVMVMVSGVVDLLSI